MNHQPGIGINVQSGIGIGILVSVEHYTLSSEIMKILQKCDNTREDACG